MTLPPEELEEAKKIAKIIGIRHLTIKVDELRNTNFVKNSPNRCYYCKKELISELRKVLRREGLKTIVDGTNADDLKTYRPGLMALNEEGVYSPLAEVGVGKKDVRMLAKKLNLPVAEKPSMACLASRFFYGEKITAERLIRVWEAEKFLRSVAGVKQVRVRDYGKLARIEVEKNERKLFFDEELMDRVADKLHSLGFVYVTFDLQGYRSGSMDEAPENKSLNPSLASHEFE